MSSEAPPRLGGMHIAALGLAALTSIGYVAVATGVYDQEPVVLLGYPLLLLMASAPSVKRSLMVSAIYAASYLTLLAIGAEPLSLVLLPILAGLAAGRLKTMLVPAAVASGLWLAASGYLQLGVGVIVVAVGLMHMVLRNTAKGIASASLLYLASLLASSASLIPVPLIYTLYLYVEEESRAYRPYVDRGLVVAGFAAQYLALAPFILGMPPDAAWMLAASASYFLAAGLLIPRPSY